MKAPHLLILMAISQINGFEKNCPMSSQWGFRSRVICNTTPEYYCLFDDNAKLNREFCRAQPDFLAPGNKYVIRGNLDGEDCDKDSYQPFIYRTNETSRCALLKSKCKEEGQIIHRNGSTTTDRSCRCDYTRNYAFVVQTQNPCYCDPSMEDCSCYIKRCPSRTHLSQDYACASDYKWEKQFKCESIEVSRHVTQTNDNNTLFQYNGISSEGHSLLLVTLNILMIGFFATGIFSGLCIIFEAPHDKIDVNPIEISKSSPEEIEMKYLFNKKLQVVSIKWRKKENDSDDYRTLKQDQRYRFTEGCEPSLIISNPRSYDAGDYICTVVTKQGVGESEKFTLDKIDVNPIEISKSSEEEIKMKCLINKNLQVVYIQWQKKEKDSDAYRTLKQDPKYRFTESCEPSIIISNPRSDDAGDYICIVVTKHGVGESGTFSLNKINVNPIEITKSSPDEIEMKCLINKQLQVVYVQWKKRENDSDRYLMLKHDSKYKFTEDCQPSLIISNPGADDAGDYICTVVTKDGVGESGKFTLDKIDVELINIIKSSPEKIEMKCYIDTNILQKNIYIQWQRKINSSAAYQTLEDGVKYRLGKGNEASLVIFNPRSDDAGGYICKVFTNHGFGESEPFTLEKVLVTPITKFQSSAKEIKMECCIETNLTVTSTHWLRKVTGSVDYKAVDDFPKCKTTHGPKPTLIISNPRTCDAGDYICWVSTGGGLGESEIFTLDKINVEIINIIKSGPEKIKLKCHIEKNILQEHFAIQWQRKQNDSNVYHTLEDGLKYKLEAVHEVSLTIFNPRSNDAGEYICQIFTSHGFGESEPFTLDIKNTQVLLKMEIERGNKNEEDCLKTPTDPPPNPLFVGPPDDEMKRAQVLLQTEIERAKKTGENYIKNELRIAIIGKCGTGKSSTANTIIGEKGCFDTSLMADGVTTSCQFKRRIVCNRNILLIDTPGIFDSTMSNKSAEITKCVHIGSPGLHALLFVFKIGRITQDDIKATEAYINYFGEDMIRHSIVVFTHVDILKNENTTLEKFINDSNKVKELVAKFGERYVGLDNMLPNEDTRQVEELLSKVELLVKEKKYAYSSTLAKRERKQVEKKLKKMTEEMQNKIISQLNDYVSKEISLFANNMISAQEAQMHIEKKIKEECEEIAMARNEVRKYCLKEDMSQN